MKTHGKSNTALYRVWANMKARCQRKTHPLYRYYGARGITVCKNWQTFEGFAQDMEPNYKQGLTLDRMDNNGNYELSNCKWVTQKEQCNNRRGRKLTDMEVAEIKKAGGVKLRILSQRYGVAMSTVWRIRNGLYHKQVVC